MDAPKLYIRESGPQVRSTDQPFLASRFFQALRRSRVLTVVEALVLGEDLFKNLWHHPHAKSAVLHTPHDENLLCGGVMAIGPLVVFVDIPRPLRSAEGLHELLNTVLPPKLSDEEPDVFILPPQSWVRTTTGTRHSPILEFMIPTYQQRNHGVESVYNESSESANADATGSEAGRAVYREGV